MEVFGLYKSMLSGKHDVKFLLSFDTDDISMNNAGIRNWLKNQGESVQAYWGNSKTKIQAINADLEHAKDYDILLLASDDMIPQTQNYDDIIVQDMEKYYPDGDGVLHYNDDKQKERLNTLSIMGKKYFDRFGYIYTLILD
jgi:RNA binding exosome subunit